MGYLILLHIRNPPECNSNLSNCHKSNFANVLVLRQTLKLNFSNLSMRILFPLNTLL